VLKILCLWLFVNTVNTVKLNTTCIYIARLLKVICVLFTLPVSTSANTPAEGNQRFHVQIKSLWIQSQSQEEPLWQCRPGLSSHWSGSAHYAAERWGVVSSEMQHHPTQMLFAGWPIMVHDTLTRRGRSWLTQRHSQFYLQTAPRLTLSRKHSPDGAANDYRLLLIYWLQNNEKLS